MKGRSSVGALFRLYSLNTAAKTSLPKHRGANSIHGFFKNDKNLDRCKYVTYTMALNLKNIQVETLATELALLSGKSKTEFIRLALLEKK